jgi:hypothetical protein
MPRNASSSCIATCSCIVRKWERSLPSSVTLHIVLDGSFQRGLHGTWLHHAVSHGTLDCSDITGDPNVWSLRPFDPLSHVVSPELDAEVVVFMADLDRLLRGHSSTHTLPLPPCTWLATNSASKVSTAANTMRVAWQSSYRVTPPAFDVHGILRALSPRSAVILTEPRSSGSSRFLREHGVTRQRTLVVRRTRGGRHSPGGLDADAVAVLRLASNLVEPSSTRRNQPWEGRAVALKAKGVSSGMVHGQATARTNRRTERKRKPDRHL